jgi:HEPN domain-containing protein
MSEDTIKFSDESMSSGDFDARAVAQYWFAEAEETLMVADHLVEKGDYSYALFFGHLAVEKKLKGLHAIRRGQHAPPIHNLLRLAKAADLEPDEAQTEVLIRITAFNIEARYPDPKRDFRRKCTPEYTAEQMAAIKEVLAWLKSRLMS